MAQAQADNPKSCENGAEEVHDRDNRAGRNNQRLQHASADDCPAQPAPRKSGEHDRRHGQYHARHAGLAHRRVVDGQGHRDREPDHDRLHDQHGGEQPFRRWRVAAATDARTLLTRTLLTQAMLSRTVLRRRVLADGLIAGTGVVPAAARHGGHASSPRSSPRSSPTSSPRSSPMSSPTSSPRSSPTSSWAVPAGPGAGSPGVARVSSSRASPAVITDPVISRTAVPGGPPSADPASASSASPTPSSIASSSLATARTRSGPNTALASSASLAGSADRGEELAVTTSSETTGSSASRIAGTSLSSLTARMAIRSVAANASSRAATVAAIPAGLCAASTIVTGLRRTISSRPGDDMIRNAPRTSPSSSAAGSAGEASCSPVADAPAKASTAARAQAALPA